jgi:hypothetical protein
MSDHAFTLLLKQYVSDFKKIKSENEEIGNIEFNRSYSLSVNPPKHWPIYDSLEDMLSYAQTLGFHNFVLVYSSTEVYNKLSKSLDGHGFNIDYFSWHEMYSAMSRVQEDVSYVRRFKEMLRNADLVVFVGASMALPVVIDQVLGSTSGCLILLG